jgi:hypothetical protein
VLAVEAQRLAAGDQHSEPRTGRQKFRQQRRRFKDRLEVVEEKENPALTDRRREKVPNSLVRLLADSQRVCDGRGDQAMVVKCGQRDKAKAFEGRDERFRNAHRQACLANAAWTGQRQQADVFPLQERPYRRRFLCPPNQWSERNWQVGTGFPAGGPKRRRLCRRRVAGRHLAGHAAS